MSSNEESSWICFFIALGIFFLIVFGTNACTSSKWNGGVCPSCGVTYQLQAVDRGLHYYSCPNCGEEVTRYK